MPMYTYSLQLTLYYHHHNIVFALDILSRLVEKLFGNLVRHDIKSTSEKECTLVET